MPEATPRLSIGLPVYNGENYLEETLSSILNQDFEDFELLISDNASTDNTGDICRRFAAKDTRIRYLRQDTNVGAAENYNVVFRAASGELFKWATHDDVLFPGFLHRCVDALDQEPEAVLAYPRFVPIDTSGSRGPVEDPRPELSSLDPAIRFKRVIWQTKIWRRNNTYPIFGVIRADAIRKARPHGGYTGSDRVFLAELALQGRFHEVPEVLFGYRFHDQQSMALAGSGGPLGHAREGWFDPSRADVITLPAWRRTGEYATAVLRSTLRGGEKLRCLGVLGSWIFSGYWKRLVRDLGVAGWSVGRRLLGRASGPRQDTPESNSTTSVPGRDLGG